MTTMEEARHSDEFLDLRLRSPHIVVADDDPDVRAAIADVLERERYNVTEVADGSQLLELLHASRDVPIDLVISDIWMPFATGVEAVRLLNRTHQRIPVILITGFSDDHTYALARSFEVTVLDKPLDAETLRLRVGWALRLKRFLPS